jgi:hypothetical protein
VSGAIFAFNRPADRFTIIANDLIEDTELKHAAFRIVVYVGRHAANFRLSQLAIGRALGMDRGTVARHLTHLEELGYLRRLPNYSAEGRQADDLYVSQARMTPEQWEEALPNPCGKTPCGKTQHGETPQRKKTNSKKTKTQEDQPSGGSDADAPSEPESDPSTEEDMPRAAALDQPGLFDAPVVEKPKRKERAKPVGIPAVVAAYVDSYVAHHSGRKPMGSDLGKIGRDAKMIMAREEATEEELLQAATRMGRGEWSNLTQEIKFAHRATSGPGVVHAPLAHASQAWADLEASTRVDLPAMTADEFGDIFGVKA